MSSKYAYQLIDEEYLLGTGQEDLGQQIRKHIKGLTNPENLNQEATEKITKQIDSLERLANNIYGLKYQRLYQSTATGLTAEQCNQVLSSEFLQYLNEDKKEKN